MCGVSETTEGETMTSEKKASRVTVTVRRHPLYPTHWAGTVETPRGLVYTCTWADDENGNGPSEEKVLEVWRTDRKAFNPGYN